MSDHIAELIEERLGVRGQNLERKLHKAGRNLPRFVQREAAKIVHSTKVQGQPKLARTIDGKSVLRAYKTCEKHLCEIDPRDRKVGGAISFLATNAFNLLVIVGLTIAVMVWRDLI